MICDRLLMSLSGGSAYLLCEMTFRQHTGRPALHRYTLLTCIMGAVSSFGVLTICGHKGSRLIRSLLGAVWITLCELITGQLLLVTAGVRCWDYSGTPFNYCGIISLRWSVMWFILSAVAVTVADLKGETMLKICKHPHCRNLAESGAYCAEHSPVKRGERKGGGSEFDPMYQQPEYRRQVKTYLMRHDRCAVCGEPSQCVDHVKPHKGDYSLFWDQNNWQALCNSCHSRKTMRENKAAGKCR